MKTKKLKKLMTAALCVIFAVCFAFPASAAYSSVDQTIVRTNDISTRYRGRAQHEDDGSSFIACSVIRSDPSVTIPTAQRVCTVNLTIYEVQEFYSQNLYGTYNGYSVSKTGYFSMDPVYYDYWFNACGYTYDYTNTPCK